MSAEKVFLKGNMAKAAKMYNDNEAEISGGGITDMVSRFLEKTVNPYLSKQLKQQYADKAKAKEAPKATPSKVVPVRSKLHPSAKRVPSGNVGIATQQSPNEGPSISSGVSDEPVPTSRPKGPPPSFTKVADASIKELENAKPPDALATTFSELEAGIDAVKDLESMPTLSIKETEQPDKMGEEVPAVSEKLPEGNIEEGEEPILCRTGTKKDIAWWLIERFNPVYKKSYMEAFFGGGAIFWAKPKVGKEIINEFNPQIYDFYVRLQKGIGSTVDLMPELTNYKANINKFGRAKWLEELSKYYGTSYISSTKLSVSGNPEQLLEIDKISRILIPFLRNNPIVIVKKKDKYKNEYDVISKSVKGGPQDNLVCLYWYILAYCNGQSNMVIPLKDLQCIAENDENLVMSRENTVGADGEETEGRKIAETMPLKKTSNPFNKLGGGRGEWFSKRLAGVTILNDDALLVAPKNDSKDIMFMFDPPYEQGGGYGIGTTNEELVSGGAKKKEKKVADENERLTAANETVFPFRKFIQMCEDLKGRWMVTINGSVRILNEFRSKKIPVYAAKLWVKNKVGSSWRFEIVYANYEFKDGLNVKSEEFKTAPEYMVFSSKKVVPITYSKKTLPHEDNIAAAVGVPPKAILKPKDESKPDKPERLHPCVKSAKRKPPISNSILPLFKAGTEPAAEAAAPATKVPRKSRAKKTAEAAVPVNEIVEVPEAAPAPAKKPRKPRAKKVAGSGLSGGMNGNSPNASPNASPRARRNAIVPIGGPMYSKDIAAPTREAEAVEKDTRPASEISAADIQGKRPSLFGRLRKFFFGSGVGSTHRENFLKTHKLEDRGYTMSELSKISAVPLETLAEVYKRGIGAYKGNPKSVRLKGSYVKGVNAPMSKKLSKEQWAVARVYSFLDGNPSHDNDLRNAGGNCGCESDYEEMTGGSFLNDDLDVAEGMIGGYYSPNRPPHLGSKYAFTPSVGYGGSEYNTMDY